MYAIRSYYADPNLEGWTIHLYIQGQVDPIATTTTDVNGYYEFTNLGPGTYTVAEEYDNQVWRNNFV